MVERTGQRFIDGQDTNEKLFKYLMDNALASKQQLNLAVGVTLTSQQVAACRENGYDGFNQTG